MFNVSIYESENIFKDPKGRSEVIPNQALHLREIIKRSMSGQILAEVQGNQLEYGEDESEEGIDLFEPDDDRFEIQDKLSYFEARLEEMKKAQKAQKEAKSKEQKDEAKDVQAEDDLP